MKEFKYKTSFSTQIKSVISEERDKYLSLASLINIGDFIPDIDIEANVDLLPIAFNAFVANRVNKNGDVIDTETAIAIYENFLNKPINIEHHRDKVIGTILSSGFSEFGTDKPLNLEQVKAMTSPFNVTLGGVVWKVVNDEIASFIEDSSDPTSENYLKVSASWELGFSDFNIILLKNEEKNIENGEVIAEEAKIEELRDYLRVFGGKEYVDENTKAYRQVIGKVVPLGIGLTETPAADVKGVSTKKTKEYKIKKEEKKLAKTNSDSNNISRKPIKNVILKENVMKIKSIKDITDESLQEMSASVVADFIEDELRKASERYTDEKEAVEKQLKDSVEQNETITKEQEELKDKLVSVEKSLAELEQEKQEREAQQRFNERMSTLDEEYKLNDEDREVIASDIKDMNNEDFESYSKKLSVLLKDKNREALAKKEEENKLNAEKEEVKASTEEQEDSTVIETVVEEAQEEDSEDIPNSTVAEEETLVQKYQKAFSLDQFEIR